MSENIDNQQLFDIVDEALADTPREILAEAEVENRPISEIVQIDVEVNSKVDQEVQSKDSSATLDSINMSSIMEAFMSLNKKFDDKIAIDSHKNLLFDKMYSELQTLKDDPLKKAIKPIFMDLIVFIDFMGNVLSKYEEEPTEENLVATYQKLRGEFAKVGEHIADLLYNHGVEPFSANEGEAFDPKTQQAKKTTTIEGAEDNKSIVKSLSPGYNWDGVLLRKESVHINVNENTNK